MSFNLQYIIIIIIALETRKHFNYGNFSDPSKCSATCRKEKFMDRPIICSLRLLEGEAMEIIGEAAP